MGHIINKLFAAVLSVDPWVTLVILILLLLRWIFKRKLSPRFFQLAFLILAVRLALPFDLSIDKAPIQAPLPKPVRQSIETSGLSQIPIDELIKQPEESTSVPVIQQETERKAKKLQWDVYLPIIWVIGTAGFMGLHLALYGKFQFHLHKSRHKVDAELYEIAQKNFGKPIHVWISQEVSCPMLVGLIRPEIYLPEKGIKKQNLPYIFAHEACHARRWDISTQFFLLTAQSLHWFNPLVHYMARAARNDMERSCDEEVLAGKDVDYRKAYGGAVLDSLAYCRQQRVTTFSTGFSIRNDLIRRFEDMFDFTTKKKGAPLLLILAVMVVIASGLITAVPHVYASAKTENEERVFAESFSDSEKQTLGFEQKQLERTQNTHWIFEDEQNFKITKGFGQEMQDELHSGVDFSLEHGALILAAQAGEVVEVGKDESLGEFVKIKTEDGDVWLYSHCESQLVEKGEKVMAGQPISHVGKTGKATGDMVHLELITKSGNVDPLTILTVPVKKEEKNPQVPELVWPVPDFTEVIRVKSSTHAGDDIKAPYGSDILAAQDGKVITAGWHYSYGNYIIIEGENDYSTLYAHCSELLVKEGETVGAGQRIAKIGATGQATGNHLHLELRKNEKRLEAMDYLPKMTSEKAK